MQGDDEDPEPETLIVKGQDGPREREDPEPGMATVKAPGEPEEPEPGIVTVSGPGDSDGPALEDLSPEA